MRIWSLLGLVPLLGGCALGASPQDFDCTGSYLRKYVQGYAVSPLIAEIQRDAGHDERHPTNGSENPGHLDLPQPSPTTLSLVGVTSDPADNRAVDASDPIQELLLRSRRLRGGNDSDRGIPFDGRPPANQKLGAVLMLSGGAGWGAFGAGFLKVVAARADSPLHRLDLVTGVSTGAIQALFVVVGDYDGLERAYRIGDEADLVRRGGLLSVLRKGYLGDTAPLRRRIEAVLCDPVGDRCPGLERIRRSPIGLAVGMVETRTGDFKIVNLSAMIDDAYGRPPTDRAAAVRLAARCTTGVIMGSAAVPVQMRPVRLGDRSSGAYTTYVDGGVRYSAFEAAIGSAVARIAKVLTSEPPELLVVRNGPTVVSPLITKSGGLSTVDAKPDAATLGLQSYSTIVNQTELMSIVGLRLANPRGSIRIATADGYGAAFPGRRSRTCARTSKRFVLFDPAFMQCLTLWGEEKAAHDGPHSGWITLSPIDGAPPRQAAR